MGLGAVMFKQDESAVVYSGRPPEKILDYRAGAAIALGLIALFALLTLGAATGWSPLESLDHAVGGWAYDRTYGHPMLRSFWLIVTTVGQPWVLRLTLVAAAVFHAWRRSWSIAGWLLGTAVVENVVAPLAKYLLSRPRPYWKSPITVARGLGYPSGHAAGAAMFVTTMTLLVLTTVVRHSVRRLCIGTVTAVAVLVSASRIFLGVHYLTDVLAGLLLGAALSLLTWCIFVALRSRASALH
jgi:undecaprenyl-diphosphatase